VQLPACACGDTQRGAQKDREIQRLREQVRELQVVSLLSSEEEQEEEEEEAQQLLLQQEDSSGEEEHEEEGEEGCRVQNGVSCNCRAAAV
jgi:hypothetical protein